jgi:hypothetical protein
LTPSGRTPKPLPLPSPHLPSATKQQNTSTNNMAISDNGARAPSDPSPPPTPVPPSNTPSDSIMETPGLKETPRLPLDPEIHAVYCVQDMHTHPSCRATNNLSPPDIYNAASSTPLPHRPVMVPQSQSLSLGFLCQLFLSAFIARFLASAPFSPGYI